MEHITITLDELCKIWLKHNNRFIEGEKDDQTLIEMFDDVIADNVSLLERYEPTREGNIFYTECIEPHRKVLEDAGIMSQVKEIFMLVDRYGDCPSIVPSKCSPDTEAIDLSAISPVLQKIALRDHTFRVVRIAMQLLKEEYGLNESFIPQVIVAALAHDIGKIPEIKYKNVSDKTCHALASAEKVREIFAQNELVWMKKVIEIIREHHHSSNDNIGALLQDAEGKAREEEVVMNDKSFSRQAWDRWFSVKELLAIIQPHINELQKTKGILQAFSHDRTVYIQPDLLYESASKLSESKSIIDITLIRDQDRERALRKIVRSLAAERVLEEGMRGEAMNKYYEVTTDKGESKKMMLVPIRLDAFPDPEQITGKREVSPNKICGIKHVGRRF